MAMANILVDNGLLRLALKVKGPEVGSHLAVQVVDLEYHRVGRMVYHQVS